MSSCSLAQCIVIFLFIVYTVSIFVYIIPCMHPSIQNPCICSSAYRRYANRGSSPHSSKLQIQLNSPVHQLKPNKIISRMSRMNRTLIQMKGLRPKRLFSTDTASIASSFLSRFQSHPQTRTQTLDANQLHLLSLTLNRPSPAVSASVEPPAVGTPLPPGHHLVYFTPAFPEHALGLDGTDTSYNPSAPFTRRMWAGGQVQWPRTDRNGRVNHLRVGQEVSETTRVVSAEPKVVRRTGEEMIVVGVEKVFGNEDGVALVDRRWPFPCLLYNLRS